MATILSFALTARLMGLIPGDQDQEGGYDRSCQAWFWWLSMTLSPNILRVRSAPTFHSDNSGLLTLSRGRSLATTSDGGVGLMETPLEPQPTISSSRSKGSQAQSTCRNSWPSRKNVHWQPRMLVAVIVFDMPASILQRLGDCRVLGTLQSA